jgi:hypothetical protein
MKSWVPWHPFTVQKKTGKTRQISIEFFPSKKKLNVLNASNRHSRHELSAVGGRCRLRLSGTFAQVNIRWI